MQHVKYCDLKRYVLKVKGCSQVKTFLSPKITKDFVNSLPASLALQTDEDGEQVSVRMGINKNFTIPILLIDPIPYRFSLGEKISTNVFVCIKSL